jgi:hypothetical protein
VTLRLRLILGLALAGAALAPTTPDGAPRAASRGYLGGEPGDTLHARLAAAGPAEERGAGSLGTLVPGYLSAHGLPPVAGTLVLTDTGLVFRSADGRVQETLPLVGPVRRSARGTWRASAVSLAYVDDAPRRPSYLFRVQGGVFETDAPGALLEVAAHPAWLDSLASREWTAERGLVGASDEAAIRSVIDSAMNGAYADSLYALFGRPARPAGMVGERGRAAGRLGEYVTSRDSLALDPVRITSTAQIRHTLAHELAHRWQARAGVSLAKLWQGVPAIRDPKRYGYEDPGEHQAEAAAFAVHFLLSTAGSRDPASDAAALDHYELLVPGTRILARYFVSQPLFARHPLRGWLAEGQS